MIRPGIWRRELAVPLQSLQGELNRLFEEYWQPNGPAGLGRRADRPRHRRLDPRHRPLRDPRPSWS